MLAVIQHHGCPRQITAANLQKRFQRYVKKYKDARFFKLDTGGGLTEDEIAAGLVLAVKLDRICPHFERMHALYGARPNMAPPVIGDAGVEEEEITQQEDGDENNGDLEEESKAENVNPTTPTDFNEGLVETPDTLKNHQVGAAFWAEMEEMAHHDHNHGMALHSASCQCNECQNFVGVHTGESRPEPTEMARDTEPPSQQTMSSNSPPLAPTPTSKKVTKTPTQAAKDAFSTSKPSSTAIYVERIKEKADYRKDLIQSRDRWKAQDLEERRQARLKTQEQDLKKSRLERRHQFQLESVVAENARKKARAEFEHAIEIHIAKIRAEQDHEREMARVARKAALLTTLFGSSKSPAKIKDLLPIIDKTEE